MILEDRIRELIYREIISELSDEEKAELSSWINLNSSNLDVYNEIVDECNIQSYINNRSQIDTNETWAELERKYKWYNSKLILRTFNRYAAVIFFICTLGFVFYTAYNEDNYKETIARTSIIEPGNSKARLVFSNGESISLASTTNTRVVSDSMLLINNGDSSSKFIPQRSINIKNKPSKIVVPRGGEYRMILSDGTKVFLNSESEIQFPLKFKGNKRVVYIKGEAFFDVTKDKTKPFIVKTELMNVVVKGTSFNVKSYSNEEKVQTTLVTGSVDVYYGKNKKKKINIKPSQQAEISRSIIGISIKDVDTYVYTSWIKKCFIFRKQRLEDIMNTLSRWYDVEIFYQNSDIKDMVFAGRLNRYDDIKSILEILESTNKIKAKIKNRTIILRKK